MTTQMQQKRDKKKIGAVGFSFLALFMILVAFDQLTKIWAEKTFMASASATDIRSYSSLSQHIFSIGSSEHWLQLSLTYIRNTGAAWGLLGNLPENIRPYFFYVITALSIGVVLYLFFKMSLNQFFSRLGIVLILSGAVGNFIDRLWLHYVIDWIHFNWRIFAWQYDFPVFNVADSCVTIGAIFLLVDSLAQEIRQYREKRKRQVEEIQ